MLQTEKYVTFNLTFGLIPKGKRFQWGQKGMQLLKMDTSRLSETQGHRLETKRF